MVSRSLFQGMLAYICGSVIAFILLSIIYKIGWADKEKILILGYGGIFSIAIMYGKFSGQMKKEELKEINDKIDRKADTIRVDTLECKVDLLHQSIDHVANGQDELHATVDNIYNLLIKSKK